MVGGIKHKVAWDTLIKRADLLRTQSCEVAELLTFYARLLGAQQQVHGFICGRRDWHPSGSLAQDINDLCPALRPLLEMVAASGPAQLADEARRLKQLSREDQNELLLRYWHAPSDTQFFAKAFLQPYACRLAEIDRKPVERNLEGGENRCPFCAGKPQLSVLKPQDAGGDGGGRYLLCSTCLSAWTFRRVVCANCGEEHPAQLAYFHTPEYDHLRVESCDTCGHYIKGVDLTRLGVAAPLVDEIAAAALDLWAREHGYTKIELNLVGL
ncbi:MAG TPA: formate dehydrogenase accessory protein FdhE [Blastocatellia bacterium]|nr:formate dehydrogenase accessory protein FdhE [Blastocatellia bacterium]